MVHTKFIIPVTQRVKQEKSDFGTMQKEFAIFYFFNLMVGLWAIRL